jgi:hypothetical protein
MEMSRSQAEADCLFSSHPSYWRDIRPIFFSILWPAVMIECERDCSVSRTQTGLFRRVILKSGKSLAGDDWDFVGHLPESSLPRK